MSIYIASKAKHRPQWRDFRSMGVPIISRWIDVPDEHLDRELPPGFDFDRLWTQCLEDVTRADITVVYVEEGEVLKGAILEVGAALSLRRPVIACGPMSAFLANGTWIYHPGISTINHAVPIRKIFATLTEIQRGQEG